MRIIILSDIHGNLAALNSVLSKYEHAFDSIMVLGDLIDYGPHSNEIIEQMESISHKYGIICNIYGNHEKAIVEDKYEKFSSQRGVNCAKYTKSLLTENSLQYILGKMNPMGYQEFALNGLKCLSIHGSINDAYWQAIQIDQNFDAYNEFDYVFSGHSHIPHYFEVYHTVDDPIFRNKKRTVFINPGSVGQPRNHNSRAQFVLFDTVSEEIKFCRAEYDIETEQRAFSNLVDPFYKERLSKGI